MSDFWSRLVDLATGRFKGVMPATGTRYAPVPTAELSASANMAVEATRPEPLALEAIDWPSLVPQDRVIAPLPTLRQLALNAVTGEPQQTVGQEPYGFQDVVGTFIEVAQDLPHDQQPASLVEASERRLARETTLLSASEAEEARASLAGDSAQLAAAPSSPAAPGPPSHSGGDDSSAIQRQPAPGETRPSPIVPLAASPPATTRAQSAQPEQEVRSSGSGLPLPAMDSIASAVAVPGPVTKAVPDLSATGSLPGTTAVTSPETAPPAQIRSVSAAIHVTPTESGPATVSDEQEMVPSAPEPAVAWINIPEPAAPEPVFPEPVRLLIEPAPSPVATSAAEPVVSPSQEIASQFEKPQPITPHSKAIPMPLVGQAATPPAPISPTRGALESVSAGHELESAPEPAISPPSPATAAPRGSARVSESNARITRSPQPEQPAGKSDTLPAVARSQRNLTVPSAPYTPAGILAATGSGEQHVITAPEAATNVFAVVEPSVAQPIATQPLRPRIEPGPTTIPPTTTVAATPATEPNAAPSQATLAQTAAESQIAPPVWPDDKMVQRQMSTPSVPTVEPASALDALPGLMTAEPAGSRPVMPQVGPVQEAVTFSTVDTPTTFPVTQQEALRKEIDPRRLAQMALDAPLPAATDTRPTAAPPERSSQALPVVATTAVDERVMNPVKIPLIAPALPLQPSKWTGIPSAEPVVMPQPAPSDMPVTPLIDTPPPVSRIPPPIPTIRVTISQVEVRTRDEPPPPVRLRARPKPAISLDDYLRGGSS